MPMKMISSRPDSSTIVITTLALTLSLTPRKLSRATRVMKPSAISIRPVPPTSRSSMNPALMKPANAFEAVEAEVMPEHMTAKATRNVKKWMPNALCV